MRRKRRCERRRGMEGEGWEGGGDVRVGEERDGGES